MKATDPRIARLFPENAVRKPENAEETFTKKQKSNFFNVENLSKEQKNTKYFSFL